MKCVGYKANPGPVVKSGWVGGGVCAPQPAGFEAKTCSAIAANGISVNMDMFKLTYRASVVHSVRPYLPRLGQEAT